MLVVFRRIFVADTKVIYSYNFAAPLKVHSQVGNNFWQLKALKKRSF